MKNLIIALILFFLPQIIVAQDTLYSFFVAGHSYGNPSNPSDGLFDNFVSIFPYLQSRNDLKFGVLTGDVVKNPSEEAWDSVDDDISELGLPIYFAVGNHDIRDRDLFEQRYGETYFTFIYQNDLFIILDPNIEEWNISQDQLDMISDAFDDYLLTVDNIFVFFHQILWREKDNIYSETKPNSFEGRADTINFWSSVEPLFQKLPHNVAMFSGDLGGGSWASNFMFDQYDNMTLVASGMGNLIDDNIVIANVLTNKKVDYELISLGTNTIHALGSIYDYDIYPLSPHSSLFNVKIYPNPLVNDILTITGANACDLIIYNNLGQKVSSSLINDEFFRINLSNLPTGTYICKLTSFDNSETFKIIKI